MTLCIYTIGFSKENSSPAVQVNQAEIKKATNILGNQLRRASHEQQTAHEQTIPNYISTN